MAEVPEELLLSAAKAGAPDFYYIEDDDNNIRTWWDPDAEATASKASNLADNGHAKGPMDVEKTNFNGCRLPSRPRLLEAVDACSCTHIKSPLLYRRYPLEYKSDAHDLYYNTAYALDAENNARVNDNFAKAPLRDLILNAKIQRKERQENIKIALEPQPSAKQVYKPIESKWKLAEKLKRGQVVYWQDYIEAQIARDHCRLFKSPFTVPRHDWGGDQFFFGKYIGDAGDAGSGGAATLSSSRGVGVGGAADTTSASVDAYGQKQGKDGDDDIDASDAVDERDAAGASTAGTATGTLGSSRGYNNSTYYHRVCQAINNEKDLEPWHRVELQRGEIPQLFAQSNTGIVQVHPKDRLVSFYNLRTFGCMIDSVTKCPLVHMEVQEALTGHAHDHDSKANLDATNEASDAKAEVESQEKDLYHVTPEQVTKAREILAGRRFAVQEPPKSPRHAVRFRM